MQSINYYQLFFELIRHYQEAEITVEISVLNEFVKRVISTVILIILIWRTMQICIQLIPI